MFFSNKFIFTLPRNKNLLIHLDKEKEKIPNKYFDYLKKKEIEIKICLSEWINFIAQNITDSSTTDNIEIERKDGGREIY